MTAETYPCEHCGSEFNRVAAWEKHILFGCSEAPKRQKEWVNGGELA